MIKSIFILAFVFAVYSNDFTIHGSFETNLNRVVVSISKEKIVGILIKPTLIQNDTVCLFHLKKSPMIYKEFSKLKEPAIIKKYSSIKKVVRDNYIVLYHDNKKYYFALKKLNVSKNPDLKFLVEISYVLLYSQRLTM